MSNAPTSGREANEQGFYLRDCPFDESTYESAAAAAQWRSDWNDAQIDREIWEDDNYHRATS